MTVVYIPEQQRAFVTEPSGGVMAPFEYLPRIPEGKLNSEWDYEF